MHTSHGYWSGDVQKGWWMGIYRTIASDSSLKVAELVRPDFASVLIDAYREGCPQLVARSWRRGRR